MKKLLLPILCLLICTCSDDNNPVATENIYGCTNQEACNYNPNATIFDDSCTYAEENYNCAGECINPDYECSDLEVLQAIIDENNLNVSPLELGCSISPMYDDQIIEGQRWENKRLKRLFLFNMSENDNFCIDNSSSGISIIPDNIGNLTELDTLVLFNQSISQLPESFGNLANLTYLNINDNPYLTTLPESICNLENLRRIDAEMSGLEFLPNNIGNLQNLEKLYIYGNQLTTLPQSICNLPNNCEITVSYNKICKQYHYECININFNYETQQNWNTQNLEDCCEGPNGESDWINCP